MEDLYGLCHFVSNYKKHGTRQVKRVALLQSHVLQVKRVALLQSTCAALTRALRQALNV